MSHCSSYEEALARKRKKYMAYLHSFGYDTFYNKKRNFPNAEERQFDYLPEVDLVLVRKGYTRIGGRHVKGKFLPGSNRCLINSTKRNWPSIATSLKMACMLLEKTPAINK